MKKLNNNAPEISQEQLLQKIHDIFTEYDRDNSGNMIGDRMYEALGVFDTLILGLLFIVDNDSVGDRYPMLGHSICETWHSVKTLIEHREEEISQIKTWLIFGEPRWWKKWTYYDTETQSAHLKEGAPEEVRKEWKELKPKQEEA